MIWVNKEVEDNGYVFDSTVKRELHVFIIGS